jgi:hypothetical protein
MRNYFEKRSFGETKLRHVHVKTKALARLEALEIIKSTVALKN